MSVEHPPFDDQAAAFDLRVGLPDPTAVRAVADGVCALGSTANLAVLELGAGTGQIGIELCRQAAAYVGVDESAEMLQFFRDRLAAVGLHGSLVLADARERWPAADGSIGLVFGSRFWHWLTPEHALAEVSRVAAPEGCVLVVGRVRRDPTSHREILRAEMLDRVERTGFCAPKGRDRGQALLALAVRAGATLHPQRAVASWTRSIAPRAVLDEWRRKTRLAGIRLPKHTQQALLADLERWTCARFGNIDSPLPVRETYTLEAARFAGAAQNVTERL